MSIIHLHVLPENCYDFFFWQRQNVLNSLPAALWIPVFAPKPLREFVKYSLTDCTEPSPGPISRERGGCFWCFCRFFLKKNSADKDFAAAAGLFKNKQTKKCNLVALACMNKLQVFFFNLYFKRAIIFLHVENGCSNRNTPLGIAIRTLSAENKPSINDWFIYYWSPSHPAKKKSQFSDWIIDAPSLTCPRVVFSPWIWSVSDLNDLFSVIWKLGVEKKRKKTTRQPLVQSRTSFYSIRFCAS